MIEQQEKCWEPGCDEPAEGCWLPDDPSDQPGSYYCDPHAFEQGYCKACRQFWSGVESFDFGNGYCDNCRVQIDADLDRYGFPDEDYDDA